MFAWEMNMNTRMQQELACSSDLLQGPNLLLPSPT